MLLSVFDPRGDKIFFIVSAAVGKGKQENQWLGEMT
jgi:hypothetical protein